jgi:hypothetical protein
MIFKQNIFHHLMKSIKFRECYKKLNKNLQRINKNLFYKRNKLKEKDLALM